jgi:carbamoyl-phosphate synthase large subunit
MKAVRGVEISLDTLDMPKMAKLTDGELTDLLKLETDERLFVIFEMMKRGVSVDTINQLTKIDKWFLYKVENLLKYENEIANRQLSEEQYIKGKRLGFTDNALERISGSPITYHLAETYKMVDTCGAEFSAETPYFYGTYNTPDSGGENEALEFIGKTDKPKVLVLGSGPIRIGQGIEFDYASVHCVFALKKFGYEVVIINNNPETVSTDFDTSDRLYFEPLYIEDVMNIINIEKPIGVIVTFGGQTAIKLTKHLKKNNIRILGTSADSIDMAEDRERFDELLETLEIKRPAGYTVMTVKEALEASNKLKYPVLMRPSYVLGGQNMIIAFSDEDIREYMEIIFRIKQDNPVLIDKYISGIEIEVDAICDGEDILIPGIMEHIERTGIHSGDSIAVYPAPHIDDILSEKIVDITRRLCKALKAVGLVNIQYIITPDDLYIIEVNPRASRTVPYLSKVTGVPMCELATQIIMGAKLAETPYFTKSGIFKRSPYIAVKVPVFSFEKLNDVDNQLGPEMKSTGEVLGIGKNLEEALFKGLIASGYKIKRSGGVFITVRDTDKEEIVDVAKKFYKLNFKIYATQGTAKVLENKGLTVEIVNKINESGHNTNQNSLTLLDSGNITYVISTDASGRDPAIDSVKIRIKASKLGIPCLTSIDTANALADSLTSKYTQSNTELVDINKLRPEKVKLKFTKMHGCGNDYIYIDCFDPETAASINSPESLSIYLSDRHKGIGGDGVILICSSDVADAKMSMFNLDGSEGKMCGNGIRCVAKYLYDERHIGKTDITIETLSGIKNLHLILQNDHVKYVTVDMGEAIIEADKIPVIHEKAKVINEPLILDGEQLTACGEKINFTAVSMGNPHCVIFCNNVDSLMDSGIGPRIEKHEQLFPDHVNVEFIEVIDRHTLKMRVWERGSGETMACGTGACASVAAAVLNGLVERGSEIKVMLLGGDLMIRYNVDTDGHVIMTGEAVKVFDGVVEI